MTLTVIYISKSENNLKMTDFTKYLRIAKMTYVVRGVSEISHNCYFSKNRSAAAGLFAIMAYPRVYFMCQPFFNVFRLNYFGTIYKFCLSEKAASLDPSISLTEFQQLLRAPLSNLFRGFGSSGILT